MGFKFQSPVKLPRWTSDEFMEMKRKYQAKHGTTVYIPGFEDIFKWDTVPEPDQAEIILYRKKDVHALGERRYEEIRTLMARKKEKFLRMLASPAPQIVHNAASLLTVLDDVNDALGTFAVVARIIARKVPAMFSKFLTGPAGWLLTGAELAGVLQQVSCLPFKARNIQHEINEYTKHHPLSKKAKLRRLKKLARIGLHKGEIIEALQTTENMFGIGLSLGPILGMVMDIPAGIYRHLKGEKVTIAGLPPSLLWFDQIWTRMLKGAASLWTGLPVDFDEDLAKSMVAVNTSAQVARTIFPVYAMESAYYGLRDILLRPAKPIHPSTVQVIQEEIGLIDEAEGWPFSNDPWIPVTHIYETGLDQIQENVRNWRERNKRSTEGMVATQNQVEAGLHLMGAFETDDDLDLEYDPHTHVVLQLLNQGYRYPCPVNPEQIASFNKHLEDHHAFYGLPHYRDALSIAEQIDCFKFVTIMPDPDRKPMDLSKMTPMEIRDNPQAKRLQFITDLSRAIAGPRAFPDIRTSIYNIRRITLRLEWFLQHSWPPGHPSTDLCFDIETSLTKMFKVLIIPVGKTRCCSVHLIPVFTMDLLPLAFAYQPGTPLDPDLEREFTDKWLNSLFISIIIDPYTDLVKNIVNKTYWIPVAIGFLDRALPPFAWVSENDKDTIRQTLTDALHET